MARQGHSLMTIRAKQGEVRRPLIFCSTCGAYASKIPRHLRATCRGANRTPHHARDLKALQDGLHPQPHRRAAHTLEGPAVPTDPAMARALLDGPGEHPAQEPKQGQQGTPAAAAEAYGGIDLLDRWAAAYPAPSSEKPGVGYAGDSGDPWGEGPQAGEEPNEDFLGMFY